MLFQEEVQSQGPSVPRLPLTQLQSQNSFIFPSEIFYYCIFLLLHLTLEVVGEGSIDDTDSIFLNYHKITFFLSIVMNDFDGGLYRFIFIDAFSFEDLCAASFSESAIFVGGKDKVSD